MALYSITVDCRIANKDYKRGDVVSSEEVEYFPSVMSPIGENKRVETPVAPSPVEEPTEEVEETAEEIENAEVETEETPVEDEEDEKVRKKSAKKSKKK